MKNFLSKDNLSLPEGFLEATAAVARSTLATEAMATDDAHEMVHVPGYGVLKRHQAEHEAHLASQVAHEHLAKGNYSHAAVQHERASMFAKALHAHTQAKSVSEEILNEVKFESGDHVTFHTPNDMKYHGRHASVVKVEPSKSSGMPEVVHVAVHDRKVGEPKVVQVAHHMLRAHYLNEQQLDELSKKTLGSYVNKSAREVEDHAVDHYSGSGTVKGAVARFKLRKRKEGIAKAVSKLTKEEGQVEGTVTEDKESPEPHMGRVADKFRRNLARQHKNKDKGQDSKEKKEERYK